MDELTLTHLGIGLGFAGIIATIVVGIGVYFLDKKQNESRDEILKEINKITKNQANIIESLDKRRRKHIDWFIHHVGGVLQSLKETYQNLVSRITTYQNTRSEKDLNSILGEIEGCRMFLIQLRGLAERDIPLAAVYLSEPWISGKFQDTLQILDMGIYRNEKEIQFMDDNDFLNWKITINHHIGQMEKYLQIIKEEGEK
jgi:hypothetical protein